MAKPKLRLMKTEALGPPEDDEAERIMCGMLLDYPQYVSQVRGYLLPEHFGSARCAAVYGTMVDLDRSGILWRPDDAESIGCLVEVRNAMKGGDHEIFGGVKGLVDLLEEVGVGSAYNPHAVAEAIVGAWRNRETYRLGELLMGPATAEDRGRVAETRLAEIRQGSSHTVTVDTAQHAAAFFQPIEDPGSGSSLIKTHTRLDEAVRYFEPGHYSVVAARPSTGKSTMLMQIALRNAMESIPAGIISLEMQGPRLFARLVCALARVNSIALIKDRGRELRPEDWDRVVSAKAQLEALPLRWGALRRGASLDQVRACIGALIEDRGCRLVVLDHMALISAEGRNDEERQRARSRELANIAMAYPQAVLLVAAQINREGGKAEAPALHHLEGSGAIEQDAETIIILHAPAPDAGKVRDKIKAFVAKARDADLGWHELRWEPHFYRIDWKPTDDEVLS